MKKNFLTVMIYAAILPIFFTCGAFAAQPPGGGNSNIAGVWLAMNTRNPGAFDHIIFYEDGTFRFLIPAQGLYEFDKEQDRINNQGSNVWGAYTFDGSTGTWKYDSAKAESKITPEKNGGLNLGSSYTTFYRCHSVDGYRFDGSYTSNGDTSNPDLSKPGEKAVIRFKSDGTFIDEGLFARIHQWLGSSIDKTKEDYTPGSGTYELKDFSLILRYSDGRTIQTCFTFGMGPNSNDASGYVLIDNRAVLWKMP